VDVRRFFESIDHGVLLRSIRRVVQGPRVLRLIDTIVGSPTPGLAAGKGLPIGNLTSQHFANFYLTGLDWYILRTIRPRGYVRYMDDLLLVDDDRSLLKGALRQIDAFLGQRLHLRLKERATLLADTKEGAPFLGFHVYPRLLRLRRTKVRRFVRLTRRRLRAYESGRIDAVALQQFLAAAVAHVRVPGTRALRRRVLGDLGLL